MKDRVDEYAPEMPVVFNVDFGHTDPTVPLPIGGKAEIDMDEETVEFQ